MTDSNKSNPSSEPTNVVRLPRRALFTPDYTRSEAANYQLIRAIRAYYNKRYQREPRVWLEKERIGKDDYVWSIRSDITMTVPKG